MGFSSNGREDVTKKEGSFVGVTNDKTHQIFLSDLAFYKPGLLAAQFYKQTDLPASIVHELLHSFGLKDPFVRSLSDEIQKNCGSG